ncbi:hypothetical protein diail_9498, partial [Diaporthe ilicicola]
LLTRRDAPGRSGLYQPRHQGVQCPHGRGRRHSRHRNLPHARRLEELPPGPAQPQAGKLAWPPTGWLATGPGPRPAREDPGHPWNGWHRPEHHLVAKKALAFGMKILYHNRTRLGEDVESELGGAQYCDFESLLKQSDVLSLNLPLNVRPLSATTTATTTTTPPFLSPPPLLPRVVEKCGDADQTLQPHTRHIISSRELSMVKRGVVIVNTARGAVIDEAALVEALDSGRVASVGLDVYENEPDVHPGLLANHRALLVPHMGTWTVETEAKMEEWTMANVQAAILGGRLKSIVPEQRGLE